MMVNYYNCRKNSVLEAFKIWKNEFGSNMDLMQKIDLRIDIPIGPIYDPKLIIRVIF